VYANLGDNNVSADVPIGGMDVTVDVPSPSSVLVTMTLDISVGATTGNMNGDFNAYVTLNGATAPEGMQIIAAIRGSTLLRATQTVTWHFRNVPAGQATVQGRMSGGNTNTLRGRLMHVEVLPD
jgi:hypothetical protein